ncbi:RNA polymerase sigma factor [Streptomyces sp. NPDC056465]|uniref:RNA polymerase sigma factor n=1 Tax=Streptomyces sp. NPDC056465 TaxID=3345829 RepID=UPI0036A52EFD
MADRDLHYGGSASGLDFTAFYREFRPSLVGLGVLLCGNLQDAEDAAQCALEEARIRWADISHPRAYTRKALIRQLTGSRRWWHSFKSPAEQEIPLPGDSPVEEHMRVLDILAAVDKLPRRQRQVMSLLGEHELTVPEIAEILGVTTNAVHQNIHHARPKLRMLLALEPGPVSSGDRFAALSPSDELVVLLRTAVSLLRRGVRAAQSAGRGEGHR